MAYQDDITINNETKLLRRINEKPNLSIVWDPKCGGWRPTSASFGDHPDGSPMSIVLEDDLIRMGRPLVDALKGHATGFALVAFEAGVARENHQLVAREPTVAEPAHGVVVGVKTKSIRSKLAASSVWIVRPSLPPPPS